MIGDRSDDFSPFVLKSSQNKERARPFLYLTERIQWLEEVVTTPTFSCRRANENASDRKIFEQKQRSALMVFAEISELRPVLDAMNEDRKV